jgi:hypothetical protein
VQEYSYLIFHDKRVIYCRCVLHISLIPLLVFNRLFITDSIAESLNDTNEIYP